jgi:ERCC4-related helicase
MKILDTDYSDILTFFPILTRQLAIFLARNIPELDKNGNWWQNFVLDQLSYIQLEKVQYKSVGDFAAFDLASLLKILDSNWYELQNYISFSKEDRNFIKEMQTIRNRWAHQNSEVYPPEDIYRDLDTMYRFCKVIQVEEPLLQEILAAKKQLVLTMHPQEKEVQEPIDETVSAEGFALGQMVALKSDPTTQGAVIAITPASPEPRITVFFNNQPHSYYSSQLQPYSKAESRFSRISLDNFFCFLTAQQITFPALSTLYSLNAARIDFIPYQLRPVLKFIQSDRPRLLIADGVGVGKTIEAGLILRELQARREIHSVLIICPKPLVAEKKWESELKRFDERFIPLNGQQLRYCISEMDIDGQWPEQYEKAILPFSLLDETFLFGTHKGRKNTKGLLDLDPPPRFDLIIVDEAHHIRNIDTYAHKAVRFLADNAEAVLFLTATPIQLGNQDLFVLLNTLRPDLVIDKQSFDHMLEPNPFLTEAANHIRGQVSNWQNLAMEQLNFAGRTSWGNSILKENPNYLESLELLRQKELTSEGRIKLLSNVENLNSFSKMINRTRRRDIGDFTIRTPMTIEVAFTAAQKTIHDELLDIQTEIMSRLHGNVNIGFLLSTIRRQVSSCVFGLTPYLRDILKRHIAELAELDEEGLIDEENPDWLESLDMRINQMVEMVKDLPPEDPKLESLIKVIREKQELSNNKIMLFSTFRHTLRYLSNKLTLQGFRIGLIHGEIKDEERVLLRNRFMLPRDNPMALDVLLFSEVGSEGLDYQFCDCMINYDLPWNPMKIEQRIGRIDRNGQKSDRVTIYNFVTPGTIDAEIYNRCMLRIGVFTSSLGTSEEILGDITKGIRDIAEDFNLTSSMRMAKLQQLADNKIRLVQEQELLEQKQLQLFGIQLPKAQMNKEILEASSNWLSPLSIHRLIRNYLQGRCNPDQEYILGDKALKTLRLNLEARELLRQDFKSLPRQNNQMYRSWETWLKGDAPHVSITFEAECASSNQDSLFLMPVHPLVKQAANFLSIKTGATTAMKVTSDDFPFGTYSFAIYRWHYLGVKEDLVFHPVSSNPLLKDSLFDLFQKAEQESFDLLSTDKIDTELLDSQHYEQWHAAKELHFKKSQALVEYRKESLITSHKARIALLENQLENSADDKIRRMRQAQIQNAQSDYKIHFEELEKAMLRADIVAEPIAYGILIIEESQK